MKQLSENILDIAENSVSAKASRIDIRLSESSRDASLSITVSDNGCGMSEEMLAGVTDPFVTTRTTRKVGLGIPLFKMAAEMTGGSFSIKSKLGEGTETSALFYIGHLDCPPLGDMAGTLMTLIGGSPNIRFVFVHDRDGETLVSLDTDEVKEMLGGDVPISSPEVLIWIRDYISELYGSNYSE